MKKFLFLLLFVATATLGQAQVSKMLGLWNTFDDKTGDMRGTVRVYEVGDGTYQAEIVSLYEKDSSGQYQVMQAPYPKDFENVVGTKLFINMKEDDPGYQEAFQEYDANRTDLDDKVDPLMESAGYFIRRNRQDKDLRTSPILLPSELQKKQHSILYVLTSKTTATKKDQQRVGLKYGIPNPLIRLLSGLLFEKRRANITASNLLTFKKCHENRF